MADGITHTTIQPANPTRTLDENDWNYNHIIQDDEGNVYTVSELVAMINSGSSSTTPFGFVNVKSSPYNALGNGSHDDTSAIMAAYSASVAAIGGSRPIAKLYFPFGTYMTSGLQFTGARVELIGDSRTIWSGGTGYISSTIKSNLTTPVATNYVVDIEPSSGFQNQGSSINNLVIDGNNAANGLVLGQTGGVCGSLLQSLDINNTLNGIMALSDSYWNYFNQIQIYNTYGPLSGTQSASIYLGPSAVYNDFTSLQSIGNKGFMIANSGQNNTIQSMSGDGCIYNSGYGNTYRGITIETIYATTPPTAGNQSVATTYPSQTSPIYDVMFLDAGSEAVTVDLTMQGCGMSNQNKTGGVRMTNGLRVFATNTPVNIEKLYAYEYYNGNASLLTSGQASSMAVGTQTVTGLTAGYACRLIVGSGSVTVSGASGTATPNNPLYFIPSGTSVTLTISGAAATNNALYQGEEVGQPKNLLAMDNSCGGNIMMAESLPGELTASEIFGFGWLPNNGWTLGTGSFLAGAAPMEYSGSSYPVASNVYYNIGDRCWNTSSAGLWVCTAAGLGSAATWAAITL
jgi:hypothetical protein